MWRTEVEDPSLGCMNGSNVYDWCRHDTRQLHPSCTTCRRTANLPGLAWQNEACLQPHHSNHLAKWKRYIGWLYILNQCRVRQTLAQGKSKADLAAESAFSLPLMPTWLGTQHKRMFLLAIFKKTHFRIAIPINLRDVPASYITELGVSVHNATHLSERLSCKAVSA